MSPKMKRLKTLHQQKVLLTSMMVGGKTIP
jgi:hypothetical protein